MDQDVIIYVHNLGIIKYIIHHVGMNRIHIISGIAIAMIALLLVTTTTMSGQQSAFAHRSHHHGGGAAAAAAASEGSAAAAGSWWCRSDSCSV